MSKQQISNNLRMYRKQAGLRQLDVARSLGLESTDRISRWEHGAAVPHLINLLKLSLLYKVSVQELYGDVYKMIQEQRAYVPGNESSASDLSFGG